ncbi:hypothetical protein K502DRAFT_339899 [Neoconidiobolus thromboides FSU 785]|nr:hypothetical protein K502DRAFT_339899 [Neoconidiobolus thromboides FSU 785]
MRIRSISLVRDAVLQFQGNLYPKAMAVGDIDHDGSNELVVGTLDGFLYIYKIGFDSPLSSSNITQLPNLSTLPYLPWKTCSGLGTITNVVVGDIRNIGKDSIIVINAEGGCFLFDYPFKLVDSSPIISTESPTTPTLTVAGTSLISGANWSTTVPFNTIDAIIADVDGDGIKELIIANTNKNIHIYQLTAQVSQANSKDKDKDNKPRGMRVYTGKVKIPDYSVLFWLNKNVFNVTHSITSISVANDEDNSPLLVVGQGDDNFLLIDEDGRVNKINDYQQKEACLTPAFSIPGEKGFDQVASITSDGLLSIEKIHSNPSNAFIKSTSNLIQCSIENSGNIIGYGHLNKISTINQPNTAIAWGNGSTLFFDSKGHGLSNFDFPMAPVAAFMTGQFAIHPNTNTLCLFYVTFQNGIHIYSEPNLTYLPTYQLDPFIDDLDNNIEMKELESLLDTLSEALSEKVMISSPVISNKAETIKSPIKTSKKKKKKKRGIPTTSNTSLPLSTVIEKPITLTQKEKRAMFYHYILYHALPYNSLTPQSTPNLMVNEIENLDINTTIKNPTSNKKKNVMSSISLPNTSKIEENQLEVNNNDFHSPLIPEFTNTLKLQFSPLSPKLPPWDLNFDPFE